MLFTRHSKRIPGIVCRYLLPFIEEISRSLIRHLVAQHNSCMSGLHCTWNAPWLTMFNSSFLPFIYVSVQVNLFALDIPSTREALEPDWLIAAGFYPPFCSMKRLGVFLLPLDGMLVHRRSLPRNFVGFPNNLPVPTYTPGWTKAL